MNTHMTTTQVKKEKFASSPDHPRLAPSNHISLPPNRGNCSSKFMRLTSLLSGCYHLSIHPYSHWFSCTYFWTLCKWNCTVCTSVSGFFSSTYCPWDPSSRWLHFLLNEIWHTSTKHWLVKSRAVEYGGEPSIGSVPEHLWSSRWPETCIHRRGREAKWVDTTCRCKSSVSGQKKNECSLFSKLQFPFLLFRKWLSLVWGFSFASSTAASSPEFLKAVVNNELRKWMDGGGKQSTEYQGHREGDGDIGLNGYTALRWVDEKTWK